MGTGPEAEENFITHVLIPLAKKFPDLKLVVPHVTLRSTAESILQCNEKFGSKIHMELTAHHLFFDLEKNPEKGFLKVFPHIRSSEDRDYLQSLLVQIGKNPYLYLMYGSDHAPHPKVLKEKAYATAPGGISSLANSIQIILTIAEKQGCDIDQMRSFFL
ncbi:amidohydrolase family protein [Candidatus Venteria ishoeyi]|uniref:Dihydroorotase n=1 Tax=Candidatus Venteria ishoeyi TaxID=1899563 RepID=A0A1H6F801_9GAMM|nr:hypothetical protein [Candidatus Venteria ishoeyi]SEH05531.1 dihydroorotase [Candidatus Venteria ishoeyi]